MKPVEQMGRSELIAELAASELEVRRLREELTIARAQRDQEAREVSAELAASSRMADEIDALMDLFGPGPMTSAELLAAVTGLKIAYDNGLRETVGVGELAARIRVEAEK